MITIISSDKIDELKNQIQAEKAFSNQLTDQISMYKRENKILRESNVRLFEKAYRPRNKNGQYIKLSEKWK